MQENRRNNKLKRETILYFSFATAMILLNYIIQKTNQLVLAPFICQNVGGNEIIYAFYCLTEIFNMPELIGSIFAVGITYIVKFFLDKFLVFNKRSIEVKQTTQEFLLYFFFAILTTLENIGIQFLLTNFLFTPLEVSFITALCIGYFTKFLLDRKYVFSSNEKYIKPD